MNFISFPSRWWIHRKNWYGWLIYTIIVYGADTQWKRPFCSTSSCGWVGVEGGGVILLWSSLLDLCYYFYAQYCLMLTKNKWKEVPILWSIISSIRLCKFFYWSNLCTTTNYSVHCIIFSINKYKSSPGHSSGETLTKIVSNNSKNRKIRLNFSRLLLCLIHTSF